MNNMLKKSAIGALAALTLGAAITATVTPSAAQGWRHGYHRGYGGYGRHRGWGGPAAAGIIGGLALGALAGSAYAYGPGYYGYYGGCYWQNRPVYDAWGNFSGYAPVQVCR
jgi:hypothetical protein